MAGPEPFDPPDTLPRLFLAACQRFGDRVALREKDYGVWQEFTWREYLRHVRLLAQGLAALGLRRGETVCIQSENCLEWLLSDLAVQSNGGVVVGVYPTNPAAEVRYIAQHSDARFYVAEDQEQVDKVLAVKDHLPELRRIIVMNVKGVAAYRDPLVVSFKEVERLGEAFGREHPDWFEQAVAATKPDDLSVISYDDMPLADYLHPPLTTVRMPLAELGAAGVDALVDQLLGGEPRDVMVATEPEVIVRKSTAPPPECP